jgi:PAS domain S-box-containing protein
VSTKMVLQLSRRINDKAGNFAGVVVLSLDPQYFAAFHDYLDIGVGGLVTVIGTDGIVRARQDADEFTLGQDVRDALLFKHLGVSRNGVYVSEGDMEGPRRYVSYRTLRDYPLVVTVTRPEKAVLSAFVDRRRYLLLAGLGGTLIVIGSAFWLVLLSRRQAMHATELLNSRARLRAFMDSVPDLAWMKNRQGKLVAVNRAFASRFGVTPAEIVGKSEFDLYDESLAGKFREEDQHVLHTGQTLRHERCREGAGQKRWMEAVKAPVHDANGAIWGTCGVSRDITKRKRAETAVQQANRMLEENAIELADANRELEAYTYTVSHDLQGPIRHVSGFTRLVRDRIGDLPDPHVLRLLDKIAIAATRMSGMIDDLLAFSRSTRKELHREPVDLDELVREIIEDIGLSAADRDIEWRIEDLPTALGDRNLLRLAFSNLIGNAVKYTQKRSAAVIEIRSNGDHPGERVVLIRDNGVGFDMKDAERLFGVFERLHDDREFTGTGIGLATVKRIIERHGGRVWAEGNPGAGAAFYVAMPQDATPPEESA